jgi:HEAT repeat protein
MRDRTERVTLFLDRQAMGTRLDTHITQALAAPRESDERWHHLRSLHLRGDEATFRAAADLLESSDRDAREVGSDILAQLHTAAASSQDAERMRERAIQVLLRQLGCEQEPDVLQSIATAFGHLNSREAVPALCRLSRHPSADVRCGVAFGLLGQDDEQALRTLAKLSADTDPEVRDWATFGLGALTTLSDPWISAALVARLDDPHAETRAEAILGLAIRGDERAVLPLLREVDAAEDIAELPALIEDALLALTEKTGDVDLCRRVRALARRMAAEFPEDAVAAELRKALDRCATTMTGDVVAARRGRH